MDNKDKYEKIHKLKMNDGSEIDVLKCSETHRLFLKRIIKGSESLFMVELDDFISFKYGRKNLLDILKIYCNYKDLLDSLEGTDLRVVTEPLNVGDEVFILSFNTPVNNLTLKDEACKSQNL